MQYIAMQGTAFLVVNIACIFLQIFFFHLIKTLQKYYFLKVFFASIKALDEINYTCIYLIQLFIKNNKN